MIWFDVMKLNEKIMLLQIGVIENRKQRILGFFLQKSITALSLEFEIAP